MDSYGEPCPEGKGRVLESIFFDVDGTPKTGKSYIFQVVAIRKTATFDDLYAGWKSYRFQICTE
jgi:hypothetical protein